VVSKEFDSLRIRDDSAPTGMEAGTGSNVVGCKRAFGRNGSG